MYHKIFNLSLFECMRYLCMSFCSWILFICCLFFSLRFFLVSNTFVSLFPLSSVHNLSQRQVCGTVAKKKKTCLSISLLFFSNLFVFAICLFFDFFFVLFSCVFEHSSFLLSFLNVFFLNHSLFMCLIFLKTLFGLIIVFLLFFFLSSPFTYSPFFTRSHVF